MMLMRRPGGSSEAPGTRYDDEDTPTRDSTMAISERPDTAEDFAPSPWVGQRMTLDAFLALPEEKPALEFDGEVVTQKMAPTFDHIELQAIIREVFNDVAKEHELGRT